MHGRILQVSSNPSDHPFGGFVIGKIDYMIFLLVKSLGGPSFFIHVL